MIDLKVYLVDKADLDHLKVQFDFLGYFSARVTRENDTRTLEDIINLGKLFKENTDNENRVFHSYVLSRKVFESNEVSPSLFKDEIMSDRKYIENKDFEYLAFQKY